MILTFIGSESGIKTGRSQALKLAEEFGTEELPAADYSEQLGRLGLPKRIAVTVDDNVNFNGLMISNSDAGIEKNGRNKVILSTIHNLILYPEFRYNIGAYGIMSGVGDRSSYVISYRDPGIAASFESLESLGQKVREAEIGQEDVESAVMSAYSSWAYPLSARSLAETEIGYLLSGKAGSYSEECINNMKEAKKITAEDVEKAAEDIDDIIENSVRITAGSTASIRENRDLYDKVITDLTR